jgi:excisionase family DNA binding protein
MTTVTSSNQIVSKQNQDRLSGLSAVAERLDVSVWTVRRWVQTGRLRSLKLGARRLITESEIQRAMAEGLRTEG